MIFPGLERREIQRETLISGGKSPWFPVTSSLKTPIHQDNLQWNKPENGWKHMVDVMIGLEVSQYQPFLSLQRSPLWLFSKMTHVVVVWIRSVWRSTSALWLVFVVGCWAASSWHYHFCPCTSSTYHCTSPFFRLNPLSLVVTRRLPTHETVIHFGLLHSHMVCAPN